MEANGLQSPEEQQPKAGDRTVTFQACQTEPAAYPQAPACVPSIMQPENIGSLLGALAREPDAAQHLHAGTAHAADNGSPGGSSSSPRRRQKHSKVKKQEPDSDSSSSGDSGPVVQSKPGGIKAWRHPGLQSTASYRQLTTIGGCHQYTISGYALARALGPGTCLRSDLFEAGGQQFQLEVFPAGLSADTSHHLSVFLTSPGAINPNHVLYEMAVVDQSGRGRHLVRASKPVRHGPVMALQQGVVAGYPMFVRTAVLEQHQTRYLHNDSLIIRATVECVRTWSAAPQQLAAPGSMFATPSLQQEQQMAAAGGLQLPPSWVAQPERQAAKEQQGAALTSQKQYTMPVQHCTCPACCPGSPGTGQVNIGPAATPGCGPWAAGAAPVPADAATCSQGLYSPQQGQHIHPQCAAEQQQLQQLQQLQQQQPEVACTCAACMAVALGQPCYTNEPLSPALPPGSNAVTPLRGSGCCCAVCTSQKLLQLLPLLAQLNVPALSSPSFPAASVAQANREAVQEIATPGGAAVPSAAQTTSPDANITSRGSNSAGSSSAGAAATTSGPVTQNKPEDAGNTVTHQQTQQQQHHHHHHHLAAAQCNDSSSTAAAGCAVCGQLAQCLAVLQQLQHLQSCVLDGQCPSSSAMQHNGRYLSSSCYCESSNLGQSPSRGRSTNAQQPQHAAVQQSSEDIAATHLQHWQRFGKQQQQQQQQLNCCSPASVGSTQEVLSGTQHVGSMHSSITLRPVSVEPLQQHTGQAGLAASDNASGLSVPFVRHHPARVVYM